MNLLEKNKFIIKIQVNICPKTSLISITRNKTAKKAINIRVLAGGKRCLLVANGIFSIRIFLFWMILENFQFLVSSAAGLPGHKSKSPLIFLMIIAYDNPWLMTRIMPLSRIKHRKCKKCFIVFIDILEHTLWIIPFLTFVISNPRKPLGKKNVSFNYILAISIKSLCHFFEVFHWYKNLRKKKVCLFECLKKIYVFWCVFIFYIEVGTI